jgi:hypothetical protein
MVTAAENITRGLRAIGLDSLVVITRPDEDRVWGWPTGELEEYCKAHGWFTDPAFVAEHEHGAGTRSYREPYGCHPALQICFHPSPAGDFVEIDYDYAAPVDLAGLLEHGAEVLHNAVAGSKTDQQRVAALLDHRFGKEA